MSTATDDRAGDPPRLAGADPATKAVVTGSALTSIAAFLTASCCAFPLIFVILGMGGAWLSVFDVLLPYRYYFIVPALVALALGWALLFVQRYRVNRACRADGACGKPSSSRFVTRILAVSTALVLGAVLISEFQGDVTRSLFELRQWLQA